jgi:aspartyl-tRNA(Asn)/glutamyl-tRNA(Gln) amidotransferase subunit A
MAEAAPLGFEHPLIAAGVAGLTALYAARSATPLQAAEAYLGRIARLNPSLNAVLFVDPEGALRDAQASAARWAAGAPLSPLDGVPLGVKANIAVRGLPWHAGIAAYRTRVADRDADVVAGLRQGGAVILGGLNMHEAALGATTDNLAFGRCHNPYRHVFTPGGSSGGSAAAVAAGLCAAALGTDTMGSVRIPASYCGVFGHMPRRGLISTAGVVPLSWTLDRVGLLARSAEDAAAVLSVCAGAAAAGPETETGPASAVLGALDLSGGFDLDPPAAQSFGAAIAAAQSAGFAVKRIGFPRYDVLALRRLCLLIAEVEGFVEHEAALSADPEGFSPALRAMLQWGAGQSAPKLAKAYRRLASTADEIRADLADIDALITPTTGGPAFPFEQSAPAGQADFTLIANIAGLAATAFPLGLSQDGLPLSAQILGRSEAVTLSLAARLASPLPPPEGFR